MTKGHIMVYKTLHRNLKIEQTRKTLGEQPGRAPRVAPMS